MGTPGGSGSGLISGVSVHRRALHFQRFWLTQVTPSTLCRAELIEGDVCDVDWRD